MIKSITWGTWTYCLILLSSPPEYAISGVEPKAIANTAAGWENLGISCQFAFVSTIQRVPGDLHLRWRRGRGESMQSDCLLWSAVDNLEANKMSYPIP